jgi:hypothetical protein
MTSPIRKIIADSLFVVVSTLCNTKTFVCPGRKDVNLFIEDILDSLDRQVKTYICLCSIHYRDRDIVWSDVIPDTFCLFHNAIQVTNDIRLMCTTSQLYFSIAGDAYDLHDA